MYEYNLALRFQRVAAENAQATALWFAHDQTILYGDLNRLANQVARLLLAKGVKAGDVVCISGTKTISSLATVIACLKLGAPYAVLDPHSPVERLGKILSTCEPHIVIGEESFIDNVRPLGYRTQVLTDSLPPDFSSEDLEETKEITGTASAYIMFTSGSTGFPKGAVMTHGNVLNLIEWAKETYSITTADVLTNVNPLYFDNSVFDVYASLFNGARLVPFNRNETRDPGLLVQKVDAAKCTLWFSVPSLLIFLQTMRAADGNHLNSIRRFVFGGEGYPKAKLKMLFDAYPAARLFNVYGPTECTCICSSHQLSSEDFDDLQDLPRLGQIATNFGFLLLDDSEQPVVAGEIAELCLLGPNVGRGYYNDAERTAASFVQNPLNPHFKEVIYKTGDLASIDQNGDLHIHGRKDNQIKHMGYRIELEEIETALNCLEYVSEAAVLHTNVNGLSRIVAVIAGDKEAEADKLRQDLKQIIPDYMIPSLFHQVRVLPKNANGKVDRRTLAQQYLQQEVVKGTVN
ncbi:MAG TPA: amino acid adenylation domain-containing protein [Pyrinomonadaceae bacterium]|nr:amino acid adenylation domain-containing protein [Pyrinomonadaceae bacterium]